MRALDLLEEALASLATRPVQTAVTAVGTAVGIGTVVATIAIATTAGNQIVERVEAIAPTHVRAEIGESSDPAIDVEVEWSRLDAVAGLNGVTSAGALAELPSAVRLATAPVARREFEVANVRVFAASARLLDAVDAELLAGRAFDEGHVRRGDAVAVVGAAAASTLDLRLGPTPAAIFVDDQPLTVIGVFGGAAAAPELLTGIVVPASSGPGEAAAGPERVHVATEAGATPMIARQLPAALFPRDPAVIEATHGAQQADLRREIAREVNALFLLLGGLSLLVASFGIANTSLVTVLERTPEIGLRRALGIPRRSIGALFLTEAVILGAAGGLVGASGGVVATVIVSAIRDWTPVLEPWIPPAAVLAGMVVGLLAGLYPATKAMRLEPVAALASGR